MIRFFDDSYIAYAWFLSGGDKDFMMYLYRERTGSDFTLCCRFRYYLDDKHFSSRDIKDFKQVTASPQTPREEQEALLLSAGDDAITNLIKAGFQDPGSTLYRVHVDGGYEAFKEKWLTLPFVQVKVLS